MAEENVGIWASYNEPSRSTVVAVGTSSVLLCESRTLQNPRKIIVIRNNSPNSTDIITLNMGNPAVATYGVVLRQYDVYVEVADGTFQPYQGVINAICATATGSISIMER